MGFLLSLLPFPIPSKDKLLLIACAGLALVALAMFGLWQREGWAHAKTREATVREAARHNEEVAELRKRDRTADLAAVRRRHDAALVAVADLERQLSRARDTAGGRDAPAAPVLVEVVQ